MRILLTGASGLIGTALCEAFAFAGHTVTRLVRRAPSAPREVAWDPQAGTIDAGALEGHDVAIHLAGAPIGAGRWSQARRQTILESRERGTAVLALALAGLHSPPHTLIAASGIGFYGSAREGSVDEASLPGVGFIPEVVRRWEGASAPATHAGIRVVQMRMGPVLAPQGGYLARLLPVFRLGLGGRFGDGTQILSWIALAELPHVVIHLLTHRDLAGPVNVVTPSPVTNLEFVSTLAEVLRRPAVFPVPGFVLRALLGELAEEVLGGVDVRPRRLLASAYTFRHPTIGETLRAMLAAPGAVRERRATSGEGPEGAPL